MYKAALRRLGSGESVWSSVVDACAEHGVDADVGMVAGAFTIGSRLAREAISKAGTGEGGPRIDGPTLSLPAPCECPSGTGSRVAIKEDRYADVEAQHRQDTQRTHWAYSH